MLASDLRSMKIVVLDDEPVNVMILEQMLAESGHEHVVGMTDPVALLDGLALLDPDMLVIDLHMPVLSGFEVLEQVHAMVPEGVYLPILVVTADASHETRCRALGAGATDFLTKPYYAFEVLLRIDNLLHTRWQYLRIQNEKALLDDKVRERTLALETMNARLEEAQVEIMERLARAAEFRDDDTGHHTRRVGKIAGMLAQRLGISDTMCSMIERAAPLHDVGKIAVSDTILLKPGRLTPEELAIMQTHASIGAALLSEGNSALVQLAERIALAHHERWDGSGYPGGLHGDDIPIEGQIVAIADVFDALTHDRPYKTAWSLEQAVTEIHSKRGIHFSPAIVDAFLELPHADLI